MKGDFSRIKFNPAQNFRGVMVEQGRVQLDSDWNEALHISEYLNGLALTDVIGQTGTPTAAEGFLLTPPLLEGKTIKPEKTTMKAVFQAPPDLPGAVAFLQNGILYLNASDQAVSGTLVYRIGVYLVFVAGDGKQPISFEETNDDLTSVYQLGLDNVQALNLFAYRPLEDTFELTSKKPQVALGFYDESGTTPNTKIVQLQSMPSTPMEAALALEAAIRTTAPTLTNYAQARVLVGNQQLLVVPGDWLSKPLFEATINDPTTVNQLLLGYSPDPDKFPQALIGSRSESLGNFPSEFTNPEPAVQMIFAGSNSFELKLTTFDTTLTQGRFYLEGLLVQNLVKNLPYNHQPYYPGANLPTKLGDYQVYLLAQLRNVNDIQYPGIRETALGGPDTSTRTQAIWQVRLKPTDLLLPPIQTNGKMMARLEAGNSALGNNLYLIEIHQGGEIQSQDESQVTPVTMKWSRNNGAVVFGVVKMALGENSTLIILDNLGQDISLSLRVGDWLELCCDYYQLQAIPGPMIRVEAVDPDRSTITTTSPTDPSFPMVLDSFFSDGFIRRWDQKGTPENLVSGAIPIDPWDALDPHWVAIENGIQVTFQPGHFTNNAYWNFTSRAADNAISWPTGKEKQPLPAEPIGPVIKTTSLGTARHTPKQWTFTASERLPVFEDLANISLKVGEIDELKKEVAELKAIVEAMEEQVAKNTQAIADLDQKVEQLDQTVAQLETLVSQNTEAIGALKTRVAALEEAVAKLEVIPSRVDRLEDEVQQIFIALQPLEPLPAQVAFLDDHVIFNGNQNPNFKTESCEKKKPKS